MTRRARRPGCVRSLLTDRRGVSFIEFALALPLVLGFALGGIEMASYILAHYTTQRTASMMAQMISQSGVGQVATTEAQIYDMFHAIDVAAKPLDLRHRGRVVISVVKGVTQPDGSVRNEYADQTYSQQFDGDYTAAAPVLGCQRKTALPTFSRPLPANELMAHAQVTYVYKPVFAAPVYDYFNVPRIMTRVATTRMRKNRFDITNDGNHPSKSNCDTATGL